MDENEISKIIQAQRVVAEPFYIARDRGVIPYAKVYQAPDGIYRVDIVIGRFKLCFHETNFKGESLELKILKCECDQMDCPKLYTYVPFDGTESGSYEQFNS